MTRKTLRLDDALYDIMVRSMPVKPPASQVVIVDIDEHSLTSVGQWPWRRDVVGNLIDRLRELGAAVVAVVARLARRSAESPEADVTELTPIAEPVLESAAA